MTAGPLGCSSPPEGPLGCSSPPECISQTKSLSTVPARLQSLEPNCTLPWKLYPLASSGKLPLFCSWEQLTLRDTEKEAFRASWTAIISSTMHWYEAPSPPKTWLLQLWGLKMCPPNGHWCISVQEKRERGHQLGNSWCQSFLKLSTNALHAFFRGKESALQDRPNLLTRMPSVVTEEGASWCGPWEQTIPEGPCGPTASATSWQEELGEERTYLPIPEIW